MLVGCSRQRARSWRSPRVRGLLLGERDFTVSGVLLDEVVYVWDDLADLLPKRHRQRYADY